jgi:hypothetical protein
MRSYFLTASEEDDERRNECTNNQEADARLRQFHAECHLDVVGDGETMTGRRASFRAVKKMGSGEGGRNEIGKSTNERVERIERLERIAGQARWHERFDKYCPVSLRWREV